MTPDISYYRLALFHAAQHNLSEAIRCARLALGYNAQHGNARRLLELCLYERGEYAESAVQSLVERGKWRAAEKASARLPHQSVRVLLIRGCLWAVGKRYAEAARLFAEAAEADTGDRRAVLYLQEAVRKLRDDRGFYERLLQLAGRIQGRGRADD
jgi:tetratricopeptide (TPR) repeat protein